MIGFLFYNGLQVKRFLDFADTALEMAGVGAFVAPGEIMCSGGVTG